ncbi:MAG: hypothetical protein DHS20C12_29700 [Pseudohongiella sp.]|nr:MAG: hypothetical protein DHS20C12_29700 [Pseudohongiella sp.]
MSSPLLVFSAQVISIIATVLLAIGYLKTSPRALSARVFAAMILFVVFYILNGMAGDHIHPVLKLNFDSVSLLFNFGINSIPGLFMLYCFLIFQEGQRFPRLLGLFFGAQVFLDFILTALVTFSSNVEPTAPAVEYLRSVLDILQLIFVGLAIYWTLKGWQSDLVQDRRALRWLIVGLQGGLIFFIMFAENFLLDSNSASYATAQGLIFCSIAFISLTTLIAAMSIDYVSLSKVIKKVAELREEPEPEFSKIVDVESFNRKFQGEKLYREAGLTIAVLAKKLNLPEYRLRTFIHKKLGFRNFNAMLHQYRVEDASEALADKDKQSVPVLTIALSVGYQSITPFNNAFRNIKGLTPSEYRKQQLQN